MNELKNVVITEITEVTTIYSPKGRFAEMNNRKNYGLSLCREGQITYSHNGRDFVSDKDCVIILPQGASYTLKGDKTGTFALINFTCAQPLCDTFMTIPIQGTEAFEKDFEKIKELFLFPENHAKIMSIFYNMLHSLTKEESICKTIAPAINYIEKNYSSPDISNELLAGLCNISEVYLRKLFLKHLKMTPRQYLLEIRLQKAKQLLSEGVLKINAVGEKCGFSSPYHFSRFFKNQTGLTPTEYMLKNKLREI